MKRSKQLFRLLVILVLSLVARQWFINDLGSVKVTNNTPVSQVEKPDQLFPNKQLNDDDIPTFTNQTAIATTHYSHVEGVVISETRFPTNNIGVYNRTAILTTDFKYPYVRVEETRTVDSATGDDIVTSQIAMVADHVIIKVSRGVTQSELKKILDPFGYGVRKRMYAPQLYLIDLHSHHLTSVPDALSDLSEMTGVIEVTEPDYIVHISARVPDDLMFSNLWGMHQNTDVDIDAPEAWDIGQDASNIVVGVLDTGIDYLHEDLADNMWLNVGEIPGNSIDDDANGFIDDVYGWDFHGDDADPMDDHYHGTHCAGTIGARGNNGIGVVGVCWNVKLMALKFLNSSGRGAISDGVDSVYYATHNGARLTSNSWGTKGYNSHLKNAILDAASSNILFIAAAGNASTNNDLKAYYPSSFDCSNIVSVAATDSLDRLAVFSNYGLTNVDLGAPGVNILSTVNGNGYGSSSGTSMAAPHVAGASALLWAQDMSQEFITIKNQLLEYGDLIPGLSGRTVTGKRLNLNLALLGMRPPSNLAVTFLDWNPNLIIITWSDESDHELQYQVERRLLPDGEWVELDYLPPNTEVYLDANNLIINEVYEYRVSAVNDRGRISAVTPQITIPFERDPWDTADDVPGGATIWPAVLGTYFHHGPHTLSRSMDPVDYYQVDLTSGQAFFFGWEMNYGSMSFIIYEPDGNQLFPLAYDRGDGELAYRYTARTNGNHLIQASPWHTFNVRYNFFGGLTSNVSPTVSIASPLSGSTVGASFTIVAEADDSDGVIERVDFFVDGKFIYSRIPPFLEHQVEHLSNGPHTIQVAAFDDYGASITSAVHHVIVANAPTRHYVNINSTFPVSPYLSPFTAATNIQDAVDVAGSGAVVEVAPGVYEQGGSPYPRAYRVRIGNGITLISEQGPDVTVVKGSVDPVTGGAGDNGVGCILTEPTPFSEGAVRIIGFTIANGFGYGSGSAVEKALDMPCILEDCIITGNGGVHSSVAGCELLRCNIYSNKPQFTVLYDCVIKNCVVAENTPGVSPHGVACERCEIYSSTIVSNNCIGVSSCSPVRNSIVWGNRSNYSSSYFSYSCTEPMPPSGEGNISQYPDFLDVAGFTYALGPLSVCINTGKNELWMYYTSDFSKRVRIRGGTTDMGAIEFQAGYQEPAPVASSLHITGPTNVVSYSTYSFNSWLNMADGRSDEVTQVCSWEFAGAVPEGVTLNNNVLTIGQLAASTTISLRATYSHYGIPVSSEVEIFINAVQAGAIYYVDIQSTNASYPYLSWTTAATNIQDAIDASIDGSTILVADGVYSTGGRDGARVYVDRSIDLKSVNGCEYTIIQGNADFQTPAEIVCVKMINDHISGRICNIDGFTITGGYAFYNAISGILGNPSFSPHISNCIISNNNGAGIITYSTFDQCLITSNTLFFTLAEQSLLTNCVIRSNRIEWTGLGDGGLKYCLAYNSTIVDNDGIAISGKYLGSPDEPDKKYVNCIIYGNNQNYSDVNIEYSCTYPLPTGVGNITNVPTFVNADEGDYRLSPGSPGIDAGTNFSWMGTGQVDYSGVPRIVNRTVDMGAYEFVHSQNDYDGDGMSNTDEGVSGHDDTDASSLFTLQLDAYGLHDALSWDMISGRLYSVWFSTNLVEGFQLMLQDVSSPYYIDNFGLIPDTRFYQLQVEQETD